MPALPAVSSRNSVVCSSNSGSEQVRVPASFGFFEQAPETAAAEAGTRSLSLSC